MIKAYFQANYSTCFHPIPLAQGFICMSKRGDQTALFLRPKFACLSRCPRFPRGNFKLYAQLHIL